MRTLKENAQAPDFTLRDHDNKPFHLYHELKKSPVVIFFYPSAFTPICQAQGCHFRDKLAEFSKIGVEIVGISKDSVSRQEDFARCNSFPFRLLSDEDAVVANKYGVRRKGLFGRMVPTKRVTFLISTNRLVEYKVADELQSKLHVESTLEYLGQHPEILHAA